MEESMEASKENELTPKEREYLNYWVQSQHIQPTKRLLIVTWSIFGVLFLFFLPVLADQSFGGEPSELWMLFLLILVVLAGILLYFTIGLRERMKRLKATDYKVYRRTKITRKEMRFSRVYRGTSMKIHYYLCNGIDGEITPISKAFYDEVKQGDDVTVVKIEEMAALVGITFPEGRE